MSSVGTPAAPVNDPAVPPRPLPTLVPLIRDALASGAEQYRRAGLLLREAKAQLKHGDWLPWLQEHFALSPRTASGYMRLPNRTHVSDLEATGRQRRARRLRHAFLSESVRRENQRLAIEMMQAGFKKLAYAAHPDRGGNTEAMQRLSRAREWALDLIATADLEIGWRL